MTTTIHHFTNDAALAESWFDAPVTVATTGADAGVPAVLTDANGVYLGPGRLIMGYGDFVPTKVTRATLDVLLDAANAFARIVMPYSEHGTDGGHGEEITPALIAGASARYVEVDATRRTDGMMELGVYLTDPFTGADHELMAYALTEYDATARGNFTVEAGPRYVRAWWRPQADRATERVRCRFQRTEPDVAGVIPDTDAMAVGMLTYLGRIYRVEFETDSVSTLDDAQTLICIAADPDTPDVVETWEDTSTAAMAEYLASPHTRDRRCRVNLAAYGPSSTGYVADSVFHRLDPSQTIILAPVNEETELAVASVADHVSGPASDLMIFEVTADPTGGDGGIGSGRSDAEAGGELVINPAYYTVDTAVSHVMQSVISDTGAQEFRDSVSARVRREWNASAIINAEEARRLERVVAAAGGVRPVWMNPPREDAPVPVMVESISHAPRQIPGVTVTFPARET